MFFQVLFTYSSISGYFNLPCVGQFLKNIQKLKRAETIHDSYTKQQANSEVIKCFFSLCIVLGILFISAAKNAG